MIQENKIKCSQIYEYYGEDHQLMKLVEEASELVCATMKYLENKSEANLTHLAEEMADVRIMLRQTKTVAGDKVDEFVQYKLDRQLKRIKNENLVDIPKVESIIDT